MPPDLSAWNDFVRSRHAARAASARSPSSASTRTCATPTRASSRRSCTPGAANDARVHLRWVESSDLETRGAATPAGRRGRHPGAGRLRRARHRGQDRRGALRAREERAVLRALPGHAGGHDRVRAPRRGLGGRQLERVRPAERAQGDRPAGRPGRRHRQGRHDAARRLPCELRAGSLAARAYGKSEVERAPPPSLRVEQHATRSSSPRAGWCCRASASAASWSRSSSCRTIRGSWRCSSTPSCASVRTSRIRCSATSCAPRWSAAWPGSATMTYVPAGSRRAHRTAEARQVKAFDIGRRARGRTAPVDRRRTVRGRERGDVHDRRQQTAGRVAAERGLPFVFKASLSQGQPLERPLVRGAAGR